MYFQIDYDDMFAELDAPLETGAASDPLEDWMSSGIMNCEDPVEWWTTQLESKASTVNPALARMAIDLLSCPGMHVIYSWKNTGLSCILAASTEMERGFSRGGLMVTPHRYSLKGASVRAGTVLSSWREVEGLVPEKELIKMFNDKLLRKKDLGRTDSDVTIVIE